VSRVKVDSMPLILRDPRVYMITLSKRVDDKVFSVIIYAQVRIQFSGRNIHAWRVLSSYPDSSQVVAVQLKCDTHEVKYNCGVFGW
jgi:hypothetical protein